jgi:hypothetical protein
LGAFSATCPRRSSRLSTSDVGGKRKLAARPPVQVVGCGLGEQDDVAEVDSAVVIDGDVEDVLVADQTGDGRVGGAQSTSSGC